LAIDLNSFDDSNLYENILTIIHLDDRFIQGRINTMNNLTETTNFTFEDLLKQTSNFDKTELQGSYRIAMEGMHDLLNLIRKIKNKISTFSLKNPDPKIFLLNFINSADSKRIYSPYDDKITELVNSGSVVEKNLQQTKSFIQMLYDMGYLPYRRINLEIVGVYRYACVNNINKHLANIIEEKKLPVRHQINYDLTL
jgi:hypothetical protein